MAQVRCATCHGVGQVEKAMPAGTVMGYAGPNGESWPMELCRTCGGTGWAWEVQSLNGEPVRVVYQQPQEVRCDKCGGTGKLTYPVQSTISVQTVFDVTLSLAASSA